jgi:20S proteasome alpha/beta subunit
MTICLGILTSDGVVIAADTEESYGVMKVHQPKIMTFDNAAGACAIAGAGDADYIDALSIQLGEVFVRQPRASDQAVLSNVRKQLWTFYRDHVIPFASYPEGDRPSMTLLMGLRRRGVPALFVTGRSTLRPCKRFQAIGAGESLAKTLFLRLAGGRLDVRAAQILAVYILFAVKDSIDGCGKHSQVFTLHAESAPSALTQLTVQEINDLENLFRLWYAPSARAHWWEFVGQFVRMSGPTIETLTTPSADPKKASKAAPLIHRDPTHGR